MKNIHIPKNFFLALLIFAIAMMVIGFFNSCQVDEIQRRQKEIEASEVPVMHSLASPKGRSQLDYWTVTIENHQYKVFWLPNGSYFIVHDPDCPCHKKQDSMFNW